jgi:hypothetical protein
MNQKRETEKTEREYGEGNYKAGREYQEAVSETAGSKKSEKAARAAKRAMEDPEAREELENAAEKAKRHNVDDTP